MKITVGVLGSGTVGVTLADGLVDLGFTVLVGNRSGNKVDGWTNETGKFEDVARKADIVIVAVKGTVAEKVVKTVKDSLADKVVIDVTNPIADSPPDDGVIKYFTAPDKSLMERLQEIDPKANFVKAFNSVGSAFMIKPKFKNGPPTMFICGNDKKAKRRVSEILGKLGWEVADFRGVKSARAIEQLCVLWCIPGFMDNEWSHAFKLLKR